MQKSNSRAQQKNGACMMGAAEQQKQQAAAVDVQYQRYMVYGDHMYFYNYEQRMKDRDSE